MPERDDLMSTLFADVRQEVAGHIRPAGAAAAVATVKRRRRNRVIAGAALAVALVVGPAIGLAWANNRTDGPPEVADPTPSASVSAEPSTSPSQSSGASASSSADPGIPADQLRGMTLTVPQWPADLGTGCQSGTLKFSNGKVAGAGSKVELQMVDDPVHVDVNGDGRNETMIRVDCPLQGLFTQVLAYSRGADQKVTLLGKVVVTHVPGSDIKKVWKIEAGGPSTVRVDVGDVGPCCGMSPELPQHLWRTYGWDGQKFRQTGGATSFPPNPRTVDMAVSATKLTTTTTDQVTWSGSMSVTVTNNGPNKADAVQVVFRFPFEATVTISNGTCASDRPTQTTSCTLDAINAGAKRTLTATVTMAGKKAGTPGASVSAYNASDRYPDIKDENNDADFTIA